MAYRKSKSRYYLTVTLMIFSPKGSKSCVLFVAIDISCSSAVAAMMASGILVLNLRLISMVFCATLSFRSNSVAYEIKSFALLEVRQFYHH